MSIQLLEGLGPRWNMPGTSLQQEGAGGRLGGVCSLEENGERGGTCTAAATESDSVQRQQPRPGEKGFPRFEHRSPVHLLVNKSVLTLIKTDMYFNLRDNLF
jgi:hypothetical protein